MYKYLFSIALFLVFSCKETPKENSTDEEMSSDMETEVEQNDYPEALTKVFDAHGGLQNWRGKKTLSYTMSKPDAAETHTVDLYSRKDKIAMDDFSMGFDGENVWLADEQEKYKGDPVFYHNLMFYFYAMPFVLADDGINYGETENLEYEGKSYPGIRISYNSGVGTSYKDEYYIHYDPETHQMAWLGYTVTYRSGEESDNVKWIRYNDWMEVNDIILPKSITWHDYEGRTIKEAKNTVPFENVTLNEESKPDSFYAMPEGAKMVEGKEQG